jgi:hypothetical protein
MGLIMSENMSFRCPHCWGEFVVQSIRENTTIWLCYSQMCNPNNPRLLMFYHGDINDFIPEWIVGKKYEELA